MFASLPVHYGITNRRSDKRNAIERNLRHNKPPRAGDVQRRIVTNQRYGNVTLYDGKLIRIAFTENRQTHINQ